MRLNIIRAIAVSALLGSWAMLAPGQAPQGSDTAFRPLLDQGKYADALALAERELAREPSAAAALAQVEALKGLGRLSEAAQATLRWVPKFKDGGPFRFQMGDIAFLQGNYAQAVQMWSTLKKDPSLADAAFQRCARTLAMTGAEAEAAKTLSEAMSSLAAPSAELCGLVIRRSTSPEDGAKAARHLAQLDPAAKAEYEALSAFYSALGTSPLFDDTSAVTLKADIPIREKTDVKDVSSLSWEGSGDSKTMRMGMGTRVVLQATPPDGKARWMSLESGAEGVLLTPSTAQELGLKTLSSRLVPGTDGAYAVPQPWVLLPTLTVGPLSFKNVPARLIPAKDAGLWKETVGILPLSLFRRHAVLYDRKGGKLGIFPGGTAPEAALGEGSVRLKSLWPGFRPYVAAKIAAKDGAFFLLDTGAPPTWVSSAFAPGLGLKVTTTGDTDQIDSLLSRGLLYPSADRLSAPLPATPVEGGGGTNPVRGRTDTSLSWGGVSFGSPGPSGIAHDVRLILGKTQIDMPKVQVADVGQGSGLDCYGILGRSVLDLFVLYFDYSKNTVAQKDIKKGS